MPNKKTRKSLNRLKMTTEDTLIQNDSLIRRISLSAPSTKITHQPTKTVKELMENFEQNKENDNTKNEDESDMEEDERDDEESKKIKMK